MNIAVLAGGRTPERDVSLRGGHRVLGALLELGHDATLLDPGEVPLPEAVQERAPDLCYLTLHGKQGEDVTIQRLLDLLGIGYTGAGAFDCEVAFDKLLAKDALSRAGVRTPVWAPIEGSCAAGSRRRICPRKRDRPSGPAMHRQTLEERIGFSVSAPSPARPTFPPR